MDRAPALVRRLLDEGLIDPAAPAAQPPLRLRDLSRRNRNAALEGEGVAPLFVKRGDPATIAAEAEAYRRLAGECPEVAACAPRLVLARPTEGLLVVERIAGRDLREHHIATDRLPAGVAGLLGRVLGTLHRATARGGEPDPDPDGAPAVLALHRPAPRSLSWLSSGSVDLISAIQGRPDLCERLDEARAAWRPESLVHGDLRWDNVLVRSAAPPAVAVVDWEHAGDGDPSWDLGCAFASALSFWAFSVPVTDAGPHPERALLPLSGMRPALAALWSEYVRAARLGAPRAAARLARGVGLAGARLIQTAYEGTQASGGLPAPLVLHLQLGMNLLLRPGAAGRELLGLAGAP